MRTKDRYAVMLERAAGEIGTGVGAVAKLCGLVRRAFNAAERTLSCGYAEYRSAERKADAARWKVEAYAKLLGLRTEWPGSYPSFTTVMGHTWCLPLD